MSESEDSKTVSDIDEETEDCFEFEFEEMQPYEDEPLASEAEGSDSDGHDEPEDEDGISPSELEARSNGTVAVDAWCKCGGCKTDLLVTAREFRCCKEVKPVIAKLGFDGSTEQIPCVCQHIDYGPLTHRALLLNVGPLLRGRNGKKYKLRSRSLPSENEFCRAVAYRWLIRWMCWMCGNTRPLSACIYNHIRNSFPTTDVRGFQSEQS